jgi:hypothetical protein
MPGLQHAAVKEAVAAAAALRRDASHRNLVEYEFYLARKVMIPLTGS